MTYYKGIKLAGNGFLLLCVLALILSASTAVYLSKSASSKPLIFSRASSSLTLPSPSPIFSPPDVNWKIYTNFRLKLSLKYPEKIFKPVGEPTGTSFELTNAKLSLSILEGASGFGASPTKTENIFIGGKKATKYTFGNSMVQISIDNSYTIFYKPSNGILDNSDLALLNQILSTFHFLN